MIKTCECEVFQSCELCRVDLSKPGPKQKSAKIKNKSARLHDIKKPKETHCRFCGEPDDGTCYFHHCEIPVIKFKHGSGVGLKVNDNLTVWAHHKCGTEMSTKPDKKYSIPFEWDYLWVVGIIETHLV